MATAKKAPTKAEPEEGLRIHQLTATNVKRIVAVDIKPDGKGGLVIIGGDNGSGKSSTIDSIMYALGGKAAVPKRTKVVREGEDRAEVRVDLGTIVITRRWSAEGVDQLSITTADGFTIKDTSAVLDSLVGDLSFDPLQFMSMKPVERRAELLNLIELPFNLAEKDTEHDRIYNERTDVNRQLKSAKAVAEQAAAEVGGVSVDGPSLEEAVTARNAATTWAEMHDHYQTVVGNEERRAERKAADIKHAERVLVDLRAELNSMADGLTHAQDVLRDHQATGEPDFVALDLVVDEARQRQRQSAAIAERDRMSEQAETLARESEGLTKAIETIVREKATALREAKMPVVGLGFDEADVTYNGLPFAQASGAEQLRVSVAIAMARKPTARIILSHDGSLLDDRNLAVLNEMCRGEGFQLWLEVVGERGENVIVLEDGSVRA